MLKQTIINRREFIKMQVDDKPIADCAGDSLLVWYRMKNIGAVRVRGKRQLERDEDMKNKNKKGTHPAYHYWVESKGIIFEEHGGVQQIFKKEFYYKRHQITSVETAPPEMRCFFTSELPKSVGGISIPKWMEGTNDLQLLALIKTYIDKQGKGN
jgi:hypothetical protein